MQGNYGMSNMNQSFGGYSSKQNDSMRQGNGGHSFMGTGSPQR